MGKFATTNDRLFTIADGQHVLETSELFWTVMQKFGAVVSDKTLLNDRIMKAVAYQEAEDAEADTTIAQLRPSLNEQVGALKGSASLIVYGQRDVNLTAQAELKTKGSFPESDVDLERWWRGMPKSMKKYSALLTQKGFPKESQEKLLHDMGEFGKAMRARKRRKTASTTATRDRDQIFSDLRWSTQCLRRIGRVALRTSPERTKFDRVAYVPPKAATKAPTDPANAGKQPEVKKGRKGRAAKEAKQKNKVDSTEQVDTAGSSVVAATGALAPAAPLHAQAQA